MCSKILKRTTTTRAPTTTTLKTTSAKILNFFGFTPNYPIYPNHGQRLQRITYSDPYSVTKRFGFFSNLLPTPTPTPNFNPYHIPYHVPYHKPTRMPYYNTYQTTPAAQKSLMEVDFTPIFLALLPLFLTMGAILGLQLEGRSFDSTSTSTGTNVTINLNTTSSDSSSSSDSGMDKLILRQKTSSTKLVLNQFVLANEFPKKL